MAVIQTCVLGLQLHAYAHNYPVVAGYLIPAVASDVKRETESLVQNAGSKAVVRLIAFQLQMRVLVQPSVQACVASGFPQLHLVVRSRCQQWPRTFLALRAFGRRSVHL